MKISAIIPTYNRPLLLKETIESLWAQTVLPDEILIGDDSKTDETDVMVNTDLIPRSKVLIRYFHHRPSLKEVGNVDFLYNQAKGDCLLHLHDDDPIYPECIKLLKAPLQKNPAPIASFGLQRIIDEGGAYIKHGEKVNEGYFRTSDRSGLVDGLMAGATSMFPNNGFLVRKEFARLIGYSDNGRAGLATDFYFGFRLGKLGRPFWFVNQFTAKVRITADGQSRVRDNDNAYRALKILLEDLQPEQRGDEIEQSLRDRIPLAITVALRRGDRAMAWKWLFSKYYRSRLLTPRGVKRLLLALNPFDTQRLA